VWPVADESKKTGKAKRTINLCSLLKKQKNHQPVQPIVAKAEENKRTISL